MCRLYGLPSHLIDNDISDHDSIIYCSLLKQDKLLYNIT